MRKSALVVSTVVLTLFTTYAQALSIVSDYWPLTDEQQPDSCVYMTPGALELVVTLVEVDAELGRRCKINVDHLAAGTYSADVWARNAAMDSFSVPFEFTINPAPAPTILSAPLNLRCEPITCALGE